MQLNITTDYAIRIMLLLAQLKHHANATEISETMKIPVNTCKKNLQLLKGAGLLKAYAGVTGGYTLSKDPSEISISHILRAMGEKMELNRCLEPDCFCNREAAKHCPVRTVYLEAQKAIDKAFQTTLQELLECPNN